MSEPYLGEIRMVGFNFQPVGWAFCDGALLSIAANDALFALLGTTYGGDGVTTFALPNLKGRAPLHQGTANGTSFSIGETVGAESVTLSGAQMPTHTHTVPCNAVGNVSSPANAVFGGDPLNALYANPDNSAQLNPAFLSSAGGNQPHSNMMPFLTINFVIATQGIFPSQN